MEKEQLIIGQTYCPLDEKNAIYKLDDFDMMGDPVLLPMTYQAKIRYTLYTELTQHTDPACKEGFVGFFLKDFLCYFKPLK